MKISKGQILIIASAASLLLWFYFQGLSADKEQADQSGQPPRGGQTAANPPQPTLAPLPAPAPKSAIKPLSGELLTLQGDESGLDDEMPSSPWQVSNRELEKVPQAFAETNYQTVSFNNSLQQDISIGDTLSLPLPDGSTVEVTVTKESLEKNGDYTFEGNIEQNNHSYPVVITQGAGGTFGSIATSDNTYSITTVDGVGVIYKNPPLPPSHEDDFLIVPKIKP